MVKPKFKISNIIFFIALVLADIVIFIILGMLFMGYEDFYEESEGPWMSLQSMTPKEKVVYFAIDFWYIVNIFIIIWLFYKAIIWYKKYYFTKNRVQ